ncbi:MAG: V-type ATP synthase subunit I [Parasporobacterium sp.]|nr:V-type ATP synthase subunit I [Parasporobacterium sp.]MBQ9033007.1 V-type ATP synthase subunit I [Parasporobacterium sp.]
MAVLAMKRITICGLRQDRKAVLEEVQRQGVIEVNSVAPDNDVFRRISMPISNSEFDRSIHDSEAALEVLKTYEPEKGGLLSSFKGRALMDVARYEGFKSEMPKIQSVIRKILADSKEIAENNAEILRCRQQIDMLVPWKTLDISLDTSGTEKTAFFIGAVPGEQTLDTLYEALAEVMPVDITIFSKDKSQTCLMVICGTEKKEETSSALRSIGFVYPSVSSSRTPAAQTEQLNQSIAQLKERNAAVEEEIRSLVSYREDIKFYSDYMSIRAEKYNVTNSIPQSDHTFVLEGYIPEKEIPRLEKALQDFEVSIDVSDPLAEEDVPVALSNNAFSSSVQGVVESYSLPGKGEIDPSFLISLFYFIFFGFMLADIGIGALIFLGAGFLLLKNPHMERGLRNNVKLFMFGGISALFFGILFGSCFGDVITSVSTNFFGNPVVLKPLWLDMASNPMIVLSLALVMGIIHIYVGLGAAGYQYIRQKDYMSLIFKVLIWYVLLTGLFIKCLSMQIIMDILAGGSEPPVSAKAGQIGLIVAGVCCIIVIFMSEFRSRSWPKRILKGIYAVYGISGYLSDILSYSRLLALGLATGVISSVANMIGTMFGNGVTGVIIFVLVFLIINAINIGINTLGAYVHTNRLQYVEFFGRFYEGGGRPFEPYSIKTKYFKFKEN